MERKAVVRPPAPETPASASPPRRQPLILKEPAKTGARCAEVAGGAAGKCAAVCCCCPWTVVNLLVLVVVKLPTGLCRRAMKKWRNNQGVATGKNKKKKAGLLSSTTAASTGDQDGKVQSKALTASGTGEAWPGKSPSPEELQMEKEMSAMFYSAGFWRSASQRE